MGLMQRRKGMVAEQQLCTLLRDLTGYDVRRKVRQHEGDYDIEGIPGWAGESKRHRTATPADIRRWWQQTVEQSRGLLPVLMYRLDRREWRAVWPLSALLVEQSESMWAEYDWTVEGSVQAWAAVMREVDASRNAIPRAAGGANRADSAENESHSVRDADGPSCVAGWPAEHGLRIESAVPYVLYQDPLIR